MTRLATLVAKLAPLVASLVPLARQAWPILAAIAAVLADALGAGGGKAVPAVLGLLAAGFAARRPSLNDLQAVAAPLRPGLAAATSSPIFEFARDSTGRRRAVAVVADGVRRPILAPDMYLDGCEEDGAEYLDDDLDDGEFDDEVAADEAGYID